MSHKPLYLIVTLFVVLSLAVCGPSATPAPYAPSNAPAAATYASAALPPLTSQPHRLRAATARPPPCRLIAASSRTRNSLSPS